MNPTIRAAYNNCRPDEYLEYGDPRYVPLSQRGLRGSDGDIIEEIRVAIGASDRAAQLLISGFRGSGKTTELKRLAHALRDDGYQVVFIDTEEYLNLSMPATVSDLWISIAAGFDRFLEENIQAFSDFARFWERIAAFVQREIGASDFKFKVPAVAEFQIELKENPAFRTELNDALAAKRPLLVRECRNFIDEGIALLAASGLGGQGAVLIIDSFEKLAGDARTAEEVRISAETLFTRDWRLLQTQCHTVYTVPPWLAFTETAADNDLGRTRLLPMCKVKDRGGAPHEPGIQAMFDLLGKRMDLDVIFGGTERIRPIVEMSGGYPRDCLRMVRETLLRNMKVESLPLDPEKLCADIERVVAILSELFDNGLDGEDVPLLADIARDRDITGWRRTAKFRVAELFDRHFVLSYQNGERWLDLHPLLRATPSIQAALKQRHPEGDES